MRATLLLLAGMAWGQAGLPAAPCVPPSRASYLSPVVRDQCGHVNRPGTGLLIAGAIENGANFAAAVYEARQGYQSRAGPAVVREWSQYLAVHWPLGLAEMAASQAAANILANHGARHHANEHLAHWESGLILVGRVAETVLTWRAYRAWDRQRP